MSRDFWGNFNITNTTSSPQNTQNSQLDYSVIAAVALSVSAIILLALFCIFNDRLCCSKPNDRDAGIQEPADETGYHHVQYRV